MGDECTAVSLATVLPGRPASSVSATDGERELSVTIVMSSCAAFELSSPKGKQEGFIWVLRR